jgi:hypothetical protein
VRASLAGADTGLPFVSGNALDDDSAGQVPVELLGHLLDPDDVRKLERMLLKKKSPRDRRRTPNHRPDQYSRDTWCDVRIGTELALKSCPGVPGCCAAGTSQVGRTERVSVRH